MNDDRSEQSEAEDALPPAVNPQVTDSVETSTRTQDGAVPSSYGAAGGTVGDDEAGDGEQRT